MRRRPRFATIPAFPAPAHCRYSPNLLHCRYSPNLVSTVINFGPGPPCFRVARIPTGVDSTPVLDGFRGSEIRVMIKQMFSLPKFGRIFKRHHGAAHQTDTILHQRGFIANPADDAPLKNQWQIFVSYAIENRTMPRLISE